jgi:uncharacterized membrane protein
MESRAKLLGHPVHTSLIVFPLGLLGMAEIFDLLALAMGQGYWAEIALWMMIAGVVTGLIAAPFGLVDWLAIPAGTRAKRIGAIHGVGNVIVVALFALSSWLRWGAPQATVALSVFLPFDMFLRTSAGLAVILSLIGFVLALVTGWLGGELVDRLGVGVDDDAHVNAPSSLRTRRAA